MLAPLFVEFLIAASMWVLFATSSPNPVSLGNLDQDNFSIDMPNDPHSPVDPGILVDQPDNPIFVSDMADGLDSDRNEWNPGDMTAECDNNSPNNGKRVR